jgi:photosystem II stability/assembly factor-like uncharacterized protein
MKAIIYLLIPFLFLFENVLSQISGDKDWFWQYPKPQGNTLNDIYIFSRDTAIAVGDLGTVIQTTDGGKNWDVQHHAGGTSYDLKNVHFTDPMNGWAVGGMKYPSKNILLKTGNGGKNWTEVKTDTSLCYNAVYFVDADTGFVVGEGGILLRTTDGGNSWNTRKIDDYIGYGWLDVFDLFSITFTDKQTGWIVGFGYYGNQIYKTTDCGRTWQWNEFIINPKIFDVLYDICFTDKNHGFITGDVGTFLKTTDGGITWQYQNLWEKYQKDEYQYFYSTFFTDSLKGWIVGTSFILETTDGGGNWVEFETGVGLLKVRFAEAKESLPTEQAGWSVGGYGMIYRTTDAGGSWISQTEEKYGFSSIYFVNENTGWAVGDSGIILCTTDGGNNWQKQNESSDLEFSSVYAIDANDVFAVGSVIKGSWPSFTSNGVIFKTNNGGQIWTRQSFDTLSTFSSVLFTNDSTGWITEGNLLKTTNKGNTWEQFSSGLGVGLNKIQFVNENTGWIGIGGYQSDNTIYKTTNGGNTWVSQVIDTNITMYSFYFINSNMGWAVGDYNQGQGRNIYKTTDGGQTWLQCHNPPIPNSAYYSVYFVNENTGWAVGANNLGGILIETTDGGNTWISQVCPTLDALSSVFMLNENIGWVVGDGIFKTTNGGGVVSVKDEKGFRNSLPNKIELFQNYPNPFNPTTIIEYQIPPNVRTQKFVSLRVYDLLGREVATLVNEKKPAGKYTVQWNAENLSSGVYFYRLSAGNYTATKKLVLIK